MEKRIWTKPQAVVENFEVTEYIAACGDVNTHYKFVCDATSLLIPGGRIWVETNGVEGLQTEADGAIAADTYRSSYMECSATHETDKSDVYLDGYLQSYVIPSMVKPVKIWTADDTNTHCTTKVDSSKWEETKS